jgi:bifunctional UDP-N-acetylglucosamine pyrophosphorylase/glucosamine-1-phosphate N-acetyltransferase
MQDVHVVVLAAGKGTRMKSNRPKVLHLVAGVPMIDYVLSAAGALSPRSITVVVGHQAEALQAALRSRAGLSFVVQEPQLGTAHALLATAGGLEGATGTLVLLSGDVPLLSAGTLEKLVARHATRLAAATIVTAHVNEPYGYGRIVRHDEQVERIVEERDAGPEERAIQEINSGIYAFALDGLFEALRGIARENAQGEYYLPDLIGIFRQQGRGVETVTVSDCDEVRGVNSRAELAAVSRVVRDTKAAALMAAGVTVVDPPSTFVDRDVEVGPDTILHPGVLLEGTTVVGAECEIASGVRVSNSRLGDRVVVLDHSVITDSTVDAGARIGPFAHLRQAAHVGEEARVGNFVEMKKTSLGSGAKAMHLAYLGDAQVGPRVNIGAGTITCNYDGRRKHVTTIEEGAFIGSDTQLIAPVTIGREAYVGTGTTVREDVPPGALAVSAGKQRNIEGWVDARRKKDT